jgi:hypothetical protein
VCYLWHLIRSYNSPLMSLIPMMFFVSKQDIPRQGFERLCIPVFLGALTGGFNDEVGSENSDVNEKGGASP